MSIVNTRDKTINTKIVYYGPGLGGKTTSLRVVHHVLDPEHRVRLVALQTEQDRTLFFDYVPLDLGELGGFRVRVQGFTVPGQVKYDLTRRYVLVGADAVIFVADSAPDRQPANVESLDNLRRNLATNGLSYDGIPVVFQYNKRDLPDAVPAQEMDRQLNDRDAPSFVATATERSGVYEAFIECVRLMLAAVTARYDLPADAGSVGDAAARYLVGLAKR